MKKFFFTVLIVLALSTQAYAEVDQEQAIRAIIGEASGEGIKGMTAVAEAIRNRGTLDGVYGAHAAHVDREPRWVWEMAREAWIDSRVTNLVNGADHWENVRAFGEPYWARSMQKTAEIGSHAFYKKWDEAGGQEK